ncbi:Peroxin-3 [Lasiodiplodia theobromae]|uniref:Peroxisomal biogenesis factor 3 n=1 Tax=Lasiodiplodia theobromae TaxID=45133 RepID=A0A5N5DGF5_9PEZI|nr:Peroxin 3 [Lasiodiplodia theobromae]KAB2576908.1 Peroxisomal biogenesis factor 3 [Lasiodiplodia theobromae]KAF4543626.1 Peroxin 3 [Lasiodiplodia theobromae]KAF9631359.1 Peroxin-3 [Lasiodiplodia theobromae]
MISATRRWFRRNRTNFAIGAGVLGAGYLAGQYLLGKLSEARQRMSDERIARENLRRRFEQNQEDCTFTVLAILPTATENILGALPVEQTLSELQKQKAERLQRSVAPSDIASTDAPSEAPSAADDDGRSLKSFQSESIVHASQVVGSGNGNGNGEGKSDGASLAPPKPKKSKAQLWNDMKIHSIARAFTLLYTLSLLTLLTRIQLNLLGRRNYLASVVTLASPPAHGTGISLENHEDDNVEQAYGNDFETNRKYLSFSWWLLHRGCKDIMEKVVSAVMDVFGPLNPREEITLERLSELTLEVRKKVEGATEDERRTRKWLAYLLPPADKESYVLSESGMATEENPASPEDNTPLRRLLDETSDIIESPSFAHVLTLLLDTTFSVLIDGKIATLSYKLPPVSADSARVIELTDPNSAKTKVANTLAIFCRQAHVIGSGTNNEYLSAMENVRDLEAFAAVVYSSNFDFEPPEDVGKGTETRPTTSRTSIADEPAFAALGGEASIIEKDSGFEAAWGKAVGKEEAREA